ncbi:unnamed protein product [Didymodactylos carnosus]|uniref:Protein kinase domain-containing protein n=1 Tax=Didymodactylos carnosus TaxID=1234261 RepID=A0A813Y0X9_9BILA|nr:unnamed protein product [Didymodactylos carnosus]CAF0878964.1 unnamed protein product [Didymodactylos carnosus]CAF3493977.1 unnamed protein product [Didymodactylos carnosus]CAF3665485.1 unnamed protein product [Didymodactylos carnosus]
MMEEIFSLIREGNTFNVRMWLDNPDNDINQSDEHGFTLLHWASWNGRLPIVLLLVQRGARVNAVNKSDDTPLHYACSHNHSDVIHYLIKNKALVNAVNEHGNTPLHYCCFYSYETATEELIRCGALLTILNKYGQTPLNLTKPVLRQKLMELAQSLGQDLKTLIPFKDQSWKWTMHNRVPDSNCSRQTQIIGISELQFQSVIYSDHRKEIWHALWNDREVTAKVFKLRHNYKQKMYRDFQQEFQKLRIFNSPHVIPALGICNDPPNLILISQFMSCGSLFHVLHEDTNITLDFSRCLNFALDIAKGMEFLHQLQPLLASFHLNSKHVLIDAYFNTVSDKITDDLVARINLGDYKFTFFERDQITDPQWMSPEALQSSSDEINLKAADIWSFAIILWELNTRQIPFQDLSAMQCGMKIVFENLRLTFSNNFSNHHLQKLIKICMNEDPTKRPTFDAVIPILEKIQASV